MFEQVISCALSPNTEPDDVWLAVRTLCLPWKWKRGEAIGWVEEWFRNNFPGSDAVAFNSGRSALLGLLKAFGIGVGDEVLLQAFTCVAVPNSVRWAGATPIYADIDATLNIDPADVERKITNRTKAIIVQHTFGIPADMDALVATAQKHKLLLIEDCAHSLGATYNGRKVGTFGDAAFFSFGRDKVISSVFGGMAIINAKCQMPNAKLKQFQETLPMPNFFWIFQQLMHPIAFSVILMSYNLWVGKLLLYVLQRLHLLSFPVYPEEKRGLRPSGFPAKLPNALAVLLLQQLTKLVRYNQNRRTVARQYQSLVKSKNGIRSVLWQDGAIFLRYPLLVSNPKNVIVEAKRQGILLGNWYSHVIDPAGVAYEAVGYRKGTCPNAERASGAIINLPTRIGPKQVSRVLKCLQMIQ
ncbi:MAG: aminotransferase class I/II-fold pyridoxal phosphate-dependent enzyme [Patescibacteria group bacterium]